MKQIKKFFQQHKNEIIIGVIIALVTSAIVGVFSLFTSSIKGIWNIVNVIYENSKVYFSKTTEISNSLILLGFVVVFVSILILINYLRKHKLKLNNYISQIRQLEKEVNTIRTQPADISTNLAGLDEKIKVSGVFFLDIFQKNKQNITEELTWREVFALIGPSLLDQPNQDMVISLMSQAIFRDIPMSTNLSKQDYETIKIQLLALGLISITYKSTTSGGAAWFWSLTPKGYTLLMELHTVKKHEQT